MTKRATTAIPLPADRRAIGAAVDRVAAAHGATAEVEFGPVFAAPAAAREGD